MRLHGGTISMVGGVLVSLFYNLDLHFPWRVLDFVVQQVIAHLSVEAFAIPVLTSQSELDESCRGTNDNDPVSDKFCVRNHLRVSLVSILSSKVPTNLGAPHVASWSPLIPKNM